MDRAEAIIRLQELVGKELHVLAKQYGVTIYRNGRVNKGWAGHVFERHLQLQMVLLPTLAGTPTCSGW